MEFDKEILQDFLTEAGEILEQLDTQLLELEASPDNKDVLNAVFRGLHTIKGGAGFLGADTLVSISHKAEDIFDLLRNGEMSINAELMDLFFQALDILRRMFDELREFEMPGPAPDEILAKLIAHVEAANLDAASPLTDTLDVTGGDRKSDEGEAASAQNDDILMSQIVDEMNGTASAEKSATGAAAGTDNDLISDEEFDSLLDEIHGPAGFKPKGRETATEPVVELAGSRVSTQSTTAVASPESATHSGAVPGTGSAKPHSESGADLITDDEFDQLLDKIHGPNKFAALNQTAGASAATDATSGPTATAVDLAVTKPLTHAENKPAHKTVAKEATVRVETEVLDRIMNMVGELVLIRNRLSNLQSSLGDEAVSQTVASLDAVTSDLQSAAIKTRMQTIKRVFGRFPRVVRDIARTLNKDIVLKMEGEETELDKGLVEVLADPLVHLVRNAVDHGIELPAERVAKGKPAGGTLLLAAKQIGDRIELTIRDDGKGIDAEALRRKAVASGLLDNEPAARLGTRECFELIFLPGFSTSDTISDISGRGVGMDVVKTRITQLNGSITIDSELGVGTNICISLPLTLAIMPTLMVVLGRQIFALPLANVQEIIDFGREEIRSIDGRQSLVVRGSAIPLFYLSDWLVEGVEGFHADSGQVVVVKVGNQNIGLLVDDLIGQEEVVIKPLGALLHGTEGLSGATITGDGKIALIIDLPGLLDHYARH